MHLISTMLTNDTTNMLPHHLSSFTLLPFIKSQLTSRQSFISRLFTNRRDHRSGMSSRLHPPNPPISGRLKIISLVGTRPTAQFAHPLEQSPRAASFLSFLSLVLTSPPPSYTMNKATLSPRFSFLSPCCVCGEINCELWNSVHPQPPLCIFSLEAGCLRVHTREREREEGVHARDKARIEERNVHGNYTAYANLEGKSLLVGGARVYSLLLERKLMESVWSSVDCAVTGRNDLFSTTLLLLSSLYLLPLNSF